MALAPASKPSASARIRARHSATSAARPGALYVGMLVEADVVFNHTLRGPIPESCFFCACMFGHVAPAKALLRAVYNIKP